MITPPLALLRVFLPPHQAGGGVTTAEKKLLSLPHHPGMSVYRLPVPAHDAGYVLRAGTQASFVTSADQHRLDRGAATHKQRPHALGGTQFVLCHG